MDPNESPFVPIYRRLSWIIYTQSRLIALIAINLLWTIAFFYSSYDLPLEECQGTPRTFLNIGKFFYLVLTIYFVATLFPRLRIIDEFSSKMELGPTKQKLDVSDFVLLVLWVLFNSGMIFAFLDRDQCSVAIGVITFYFVCMVLAAGLVVVGLCCVGWFAYAFISSKENKEKQAIQTREMDEYTKL